jgi:beta-glucanase (GH16 family)
MRRSLKSLRLVANLVAYCLCCLSSASGQDVQTTLPKALKGYELTWHDEFDGGSLDRTKWGYRSLGKRGDLYNSENAVSLDGNGNLVIRAYLSGDSVVSGMIHTEGLFSQLYGYFECRAKLHVLPGLWSAFWLQSSINVDRGTPEKNGAEIDVFEYFPHARVDAVSHSLHHGGYGATHGLLGPFYTILQAPRDGFHTYGLEWTPTEYVIYVDGQESVRGNTLISKVPEFLILSMEGLAQTAGPIDRRKLPDAFVVDYVRVYAKRK